MAEIILFPTHPGYCKECIYDDGRRGTCSSDDYNKHSYEVNCVWKYCPYRKVKKS